MNNQRNTNLFIIGFLLVGFLIGFPDFLHAETARKGMTFAEILNILGTTAAIVGLIAIVLVEFLFRDRLSRSTYFLCLPVVLFVLPIFTLTGTSSTVMKETKSVDSCATCHEMKPFVNEMRAPNGTSLAARHYKNRYIKSHQCHECHTGYGAHGDLAAKRDGFRHWVMHMTNTQPDPIRFRGSYPNSNCLECHLDTKKFNRVKSHQALSERLYENRVSCAQCHGPPHPVPEERTNWFHKEQNND